MCGHCSYIELNSRIEARATVYEVMKDNRLVSRQRHQRNVISAFGHFASFLLNLANNLLMIPAGYGSERGTYFALFAFFIPSTNFFLTPLIETACSESLRRSLFNVDGLCDFMRDRLREARLW